MSAQVEATRGFPTVRIASRNGSLPVEVCLVAQLGPGGGDRLVASASGQQRGHASFVDALDEPSAKLFGTDLARLDATSFYSFAVGAGGHPFHRHAGHRVFTAISGSAGAQLRFSSLPDAVLDNDPAAFLDSVELVDVPPDSLFAVRFGGGTWHQFAHRDGTSTGHPVFFALSCHTNELGGIDDQSLAEQVRSGQADIPSLTELLPPPVAQLLARTPRPFAHARRTTLSLHAAPGSIGARICAGVRVRAGRVANALAALRTGTGFIGHDLPGRVQAMAQPPGDWLLAAQFGNGFHHQDACSLSIPAAGESRTPAVLLADVLEGFLDNRPRSVSWLMQLRNALVRPLRLRTSPLGCPVSSLLSKDAPGLFAGRFPVLAQHIAEDGSHAEVLLGADDRHLSFRSCVRVEREGGCMRICLGTRVQCRNLFGRGYMAAIDGVHRRHIAPVLLRSAVAHALRDPVQVPFARAAVA